MLTIKNLTNSPHELTIVLPAMGSVSGLTFAPAYLAAIEGLGYFELSEASDPLDHDHDGKKGGTADAEEAEGDEVKAFVSLMLDASAEDVAALVDGDDRPSDAVLRTYIEARTGKKAHPNAKSDTLADKAKDAASAPVEGAE
jgi:hypothetical protein